MIRRRRSMVAVRRIDARLGGGVTGGSPAWGEPMAAVLALLAAALLAMPARANQAAGPEPNPAPGNAAPQPPRSPRAPAARPRRTPTPSSPRPRPNRPRRYRRRHPRTSPLPSRRQNPPPTPPAPEEPPPSIIPWLSLPPRLPPTQIHAFVSQGYFRSTRNNYLIDNSTHGSFEFTEVGINFTQLLTDELRTGIQLFSRQLGKDGDFRARMDWFYLDYHFADWLGLRAGRTKIPVRPLQRDQRHRLGARPDPVAAVALSDRQPQPPAGADRCRALRLSRFGYRRRPGIPVLRRHAVRRSAGPDRRARS